MKRKIFLPAYAALLAVLISSCAQKPSSEHTPEKSVSDRKDCAAEATLGASIDCIVSAWSKKVAGPAVFDTRPDFKSGSSPLEQDLLAKNRDAAVAHLRDRLKNTDSDSFIAVALLLGELKATEADEEFKTAYREAKEFYGWDGSFPDTLNEHQFPKHFAIERALEKIHGSSFDKLFKLSEAQAKELQKRNDSSALFVLFKAKPKIAERLVREMLGKGKNAETKCEGRFLMVAYFPRSMPSSPKSLLGKPDTVRNGALLYDCGADHWPRVMKVKAGNPPSAEMIYEKL